jgi:hypothetical protein
MKLYRLGLFAVLILSFQLQSNIVFTKKACPLIVQSSRLIKRHAANQPSFDLNESFKGEDWARYWRHFPYAASAVKDIFNARNKTPKEFNFVISPNIPWSYAVYLNTFYYEQKDVAEFDNTLERSIKGLQEKKRLSWDIMKDGMVNKQLHALLVKGIIGHELQHAFDRTIFIELLRTDLHSENSLCKLFKEFEYKADQYASQDPAIIEALGTYLMHRYLLNKKEGELHPPYLERAKRLFELSKSIKTKNKNIIPELHEHAGHFL